MKITLLLTGKTNDDYIQKGMDNYIKRMKRYIGFKVEIIPALKKAGSLSQQQIKEKEGELILAKILKGDTLVLLDENGKEMNSIDFSKYLQKNMLQSVKNLVLWWEEPMDSVMMFINEPTSSFPFLK